MPYAEFPADEIIDCHFKKDDDGGPPDPGEGGSYVCGEWGYDFPGDGFYVIYYDNPPPSACGDYVHLPPPARIPFRVNRDLIVPPSLVSPRADHAWSSGFPYYLSGSGIHFNPAMDPLLDCEMGHTPLMVSATAFEITWETELGVLPGPPGRLPCIVLTGQGNGLGLTNAMIDPEFNIYAPTMPTSPNWGPAPITYDVESWGPGIMLTMGYAEYAIAGTDGCYMPQYFNNVSFKIKAICGGGGGGARTTRLTRGRIPRNRVLMNG